MNENNRHGTWTKKRPRLHLDRCLTPKCSNRTTVVVLAAMAIAMLLLHTSGTVNNQAMVSDRYNRISSAAYSHLRRVFRRTVENDIEPLSSVYCSSECPCACRPWRGPNDADPPEPAISNCGPTADRRGSHQNVLAYTYYGTNVTAYLNGIKDNAMRALGFYPGWITRIYYNGKDNFPAWNKAACEVICQFPKVDLCDVRRLHGLGDISNQTATIWRFAVIADESVDRFVMRDLDSILTERERDAVDEWVESNKTFHIMRDHPFHGAPILAGMWGGWNRDLEKMHLLRQRMLESVNPIGKYWWDQRLLKRILWPELLRSSDFISHDSYQCMNFPNTRPYPSKRKNMTEFIGSQYTRVTITVQRECPLDCRPPKHMDWKYC